jgi:hypothetical protein
MFAIIGLVTDLGYMQYVKKSTQAAADAAARAAIFSFMTPIMDRVTHAAAG